MKREVGDSQSTQYWVKRTKKKPEKFLKVSDKVHHESISTICQNCPLPILLTGKEPTDHVKLRYKLLQETWNLQQLKIERILQDANLNLFNNLLDFIVSHKRTEQKLRKEKFEVGFLQLGSNIANNLRIFKDFQQYLYDLSVDNGLEFKVVNLSARTCANIKATIREIVKQVTTDYTPTEGDGDGGEGEEDDDDEEDDEEKDEDDDDEDFDGDEDAKKYHGKIAYDFDIISDWCQEQFSKEGTDFSTTRHRIVVIIQDSDALPNQLLNQVLKLIYSYSDIIPMNLVVGLSSINSNISSWLNNNLSNELRIGIRGNLFRTVENKTLGHSICNDLFLQNKQDEEGTFLLSPELISIILNRFQNSNNSIDSLVASFKLAYMIHFYQLPLVVLLSEKFDNKYTDLYVEALRKLPSFKRNIEIKLDSKEPLLEEVKSLLQDSTTVMKLFQDSVQRSKLEKFKLINTMNVLYCLQDREKFTNFKEKIEIYQLLVTRQIFSSLYLTNLCNSLKIILQEQIEFIRNLPYELRDGSERDIALAKFQQQISTQISTDQFLTYLKKYLKIYLENHQLPLYEVFTILGGSISPTKMELLEEKSKNLIINLLRPELRNMLESGLDDSGSYLANGLIDRDLDTRDSDWDTQPILTKLFRVYKDAPVNINIFDFYTAFRESFNKDLDLPYLIDSIDKYKKSDPEFQLLREDLQEIIEGNDIKDAKWNKILFAWFLQGCFELLQMGIVKEKPKGDYLEKVIWKGV